MYVTFVRPILEYASVVWYTCSISDTVNLKKVQLYAARIVTGLLILASRVFYIKKLAGSHYAKEEEKPQCIKCTQLPM